LYTPSNIRGTSGTGYVNAVTDLMGIRYIRMLRGISWVSA
jgi:hypothetical protein